MARRVVFVGSHLGYPMDRTPLGGGAMVGAQLAAHWARRPAGWPNFELVALGSGPRAPASGLRYARLPEGEFDGREEGIVHLSELRYARFCRRFEKETTDWILARRAELPPETTSVLVNDISEGPDLARLAAAGYPIVSIWHVDVVDYFAKMYLKGLPARSLARGHERLARLGLGGALPDVLKLVFEKQRETVRWSTTMIFPSQGMVEQVASCYGGSLAPEAELRSRCRVIPWGAWREDWSEAEVAKLAAEARARYAIGPNTRVLLTISRISPEKGLHLLLEALALLEKTGRLPDDVCAVIGGAPAFMQGEAYLRRVRRAAARLKKVRVFFPGYLAPAQKQAHYRVSHLFASPSVHESYGLNIAEALSAGLPVLASDHYGVRELLQPSFGRVAAYAGGVSPQGALARELERLLQDPSALVAMGRAASAAAASMSFERAGGKVFSTALEAAAQPALPGGRA